MIAVFLSESYMISFHVLNANLLDIDHARDLNVEEKGPNAAHIYSMTALPTKVSTIVS